MSEIERVQAALSALLDALEDLADDATAAGVHLEYWPLARQRAVRAIEAVVVNE